MTIWPLAVMFQDYEKPDFCITILKILEIYAFGYSYIMAVRV